MGVDTEILGNAGPGHSIEHEGRLYHFSLIGQKEKADWEELLLRRASRAAEIMAAHKPAGWLDEKLSRLNDEYMDGEFALVSERSLSLLKKPGGVQMLVGILTGRDMTELAPLLAAKLGRVKALLNLIIRESFPGVKIADADPNG